MLANVFTKTVRDRWVGVAIGTFAVVLFLLLGMAVYRSIDISLYTEMPDAIRNLFGYASATDAGGLALGAIYTFYGGLTIAGLAIAMGGGSIAREERSGTIGVLLGNPRSRMQVQLATAASMVSLVLAASLALWAGGHLVAGALGVDVSELSVAGVSLHVFANGLFYGFLAMAIGGWTGKTSAAWGGATAVMLLSYLAAGVLPLVSGLADLARAFPWHYFDSSEPAINGPHWGHLGVLLGGSAVLGFLAVVGVRRRDLRRQSVRETLVDRLRRQPLTRAVVDRLAGSARVSRIWVKTASDHQLLVIITGYVVLLVGVIMGPFFTAVDQDLAGFTEQLPEALLTAFGVSDIATPEGWYMAENFSFMLPAAVIAVTTVIGARALAGEEANRTMGLLLAGPVSRTQVVVEKWIAMVVHAVVLGVLAFVGTALGSLMAGLDMSLGNITAISAQLVLLGLVFGGVALALGAGSGRTRVAIFGTAGIALAFFLLDALLPLSDALAGWARLSPFYFYAESDPLSTGMPWAHAGVLAALAGLLVSASIWLFRRRDLRLGG